MKKILTLLILIFGVLSTMAQSQYTLTIDGYVGQGRSSCGSGSNGLKRIIVHYERGAPRTIHDFGRYINRDFDYTVNFDRSNRIVRLEFRSTSRDRNSFGDCSRSYHDTKFIDFSTFCLIRNYQKEDFLERRFRRGNVLISIVPNIDLSFADGTPANRINSGCESGSIDINATSGFAPANDIYNWEFYDPVNTETRNHPDYQALINAEARARGNWLNCIRTGDPDRCIAQEFAWIAAQQALNSYTGPTTIQVSVWRPIPNKTGQSNIALRLQDLYNNSADREAAVNQNIIIRMSPSCNVFNARTNEVTIQYLPDPPEVTRTEIDQPTCSYSGDAGFSLFFDRQINSFEAVNINLLRRLDNGTTYVPHDNNTNIRSFTQVNATTYRYDWRTSSGVNLTDGQYRVEVTGYRRGGSSSAPFCDPFIRNFTISAPTEVQFTTSKIRDEFCPDANDGQIRITASGGSGTYQYRLNPWLSWQSLPSSTYTVTNLSPRSYNISVRDSRGCVAQNNIPAPITILEKDPIEHPQNTGSVLVTHPGAPGANDGSIQIASVGGGTPFTNSTGNYYNYTLFVNGSSTNTVARATVNGFTINGLSAANYQIQYTDNNGCVSDLISLPTLVDPQPITFNIQKQDPSCSDANDGRLTLTNLAGGYPPYLITWRKDGNAYGAVNATSVSGDQGNYEVVVTDSRSGRREQTNIRFDNVPLPIAIADIAIQPITCFGGEATVTVTASGGASGTYQYALWNGSNTVWQNSNVFNLRANTNTGYIFRVRDRNTSSCISEISARQFISQPSEIRVTSTNTINNNIFGDNQGSIVITIAGGNPNYTVNWERNGTSIPNTGTSISGLIAGIYVPVIRDASSCVVRGTGITITEPDELLVTIVENTAVPCHGETGILRANVTGGSGSYTYEWFREGNAIGGQTSAILPNVQSGNYSVRIRDGFTSNQDTHVLGEPDPLGLSLSKRDVSCFNGTNGQIMLTSQGGTRPYEFSIDNRQSYISENDLTNFTIEGLSDGAYEVWIRDANGCELSSPESITLIAPDEIVITQTALDYVTTIGGTNGSIAISVSGGVGTYSYSWTKLNDPTFTRTTANIDNLSVGSYTVQVRDNNNCLVERTFEMLEPLPLEVNITVETPILCHGDVLGELVATVSGGYPINATPADFEYQWYRIENSIETPLNTDLTLDRLTDLPAGTYRVVATDITRVNSDDVIDLTQPDDLVVNLDNVSHINCYGDATGAIEVTVVGGPRDASTGQYLPYAFRWSKQEDPSFQAATEDLENVTAGTYELVVIDDNLCTTTLVPSVEIRQPDAALEIYDVTPVNLTGFQTQNGSISVEVRGGTIPYTYEWSDLEDPSYTSSSQDIDNLSIGRYRLLVTDDNNCTTSIVREITEPNQLIVNITPQTDDEGIQCNGERTVLPLVTTTEGGVGSYTYEWFEQQDPSRVLFTASATENVIAGVYTVVVTDENGNTDSDTYEVIQPDEISITESVRDLLCRGDRDGSIDISVTGGVPPYTYRWSNGESSQDISDLTAGIYGITIIDTRGCVFERDIEVTQPTGLFVLGDIERVYPSADGIRDGRITINIAGGTPPYRYEWRDFDGILQSSTTNTISNLGIEKYSVTVIDANNCVLFIEDVDLFEPPALEVSIEPVNVISCFGSSTSGSLSAIAVGGIPFNSTKQYNYQWFNADTNTSVGIDSYLLQGIPAGNYYVTTTDAVGTSSTSVVFEITQPDPLVAVLEADYMNCGDENDWTIIPRIEGGTAPYTYVWNNGATTERLSNMIAGTYSVDIVDVRGCQTSASITINLPETLSTSALITIPTCFGGCDGAILLETQGGTGPYTYQWSNNSNDEDIVNVCSGTYMVLVTDAKGCQITREFEIGDPEQLTIELGEDVTLCQDQTFTLNATIDDPNASYVWTSDNGFSSTQPVIEVIDIGIYEAVVTDSNGCIARDTIFVDRSDEIISAQFIASTQVFTGEEFVIVDNSDPEPDSVDWIFPDDAIVIYEDDDYAELLFENPGEYEITLQTYIGLCTTSVTKRVIVVDKEFENDDPDGDNTAEIESFIDYLVYPNPTSNGQFTVDVHLKNAQDISLKVFNITNNTLLDSRSGQANDTYSFAYDMSNLPTGIYFILLETNTGSQVRKLVIE